MSDTLYVAIGGAPAITAVVDGFYARLVADPVVRHHFAPERMASLKAAQVRWFTAVLQGEPPPADLADAHAHLQITDQQVAAVVGHLDSVLTEAGVDQRMRRAVNATVSRMWYARQF
jgi:hemoglobin